MINKKVLEKITNLESIIKSKERRIEMFNSLEIKKENYYKKEKIINRYLKAIKSIKAEIKELKENNVFNKEN